MSNGPLFESRGASVGWGRRAVLSGLDFSLSRGEWLGIVGPNGSGKSTLLRALLGLSAPLAGTMRRDADWRAGYVPQRESIEPLLRYDALEVVSMAALPDLWLPLSGTSRRRAAAREALASVGLADAARRSYRDLSGGQKQRVLLARALASGPTVLVLDEPTTGMDIRAEEELLALLRRLRKERGFAIVLVTHALGIVADEADTAGLVTGDTCVFGRVGELVTPERLAAVWGTRVTIDTAGGRRVIRAERSA